MPERKTHISLLNLPDAMVSSLGGTYDVLTSMSLLHTFNDSIPEHSPFEVEIVAADASATETASGSPISAHKTIAEVKRTDIVVIPSLLVAQSEWEVGRYRREVRWLQEMHRSGAIISSACSGVLLLAETGLLDGLEATVHWAYTSTFRRNFPEVLLKAEQILIASGARKEFVMSGASASWHDLVLYLITRSSDQPERRLSCGFFCSNGTRLARLHIHHLLRRLITLMPLSSAFKNG